MYTKPIKNKTVNAFYHLYGECETDFAGIPEEGKKIMDTIDRSINKHSIEASGPVVWIYRDKGNGRVHLKAGITVTENTLPVESLKVEKYTEEQSFYTEFQGSMLQMPDA